MHLSKITFLERLANLFELLIILFVLIMALIMQFILHELPCPLCLLQRAGFFGVVIGFFLNLKFGLRSSHYAIAIISGLYTSFVALRQIALHVIPGYGAYGIALFGFHLYTWSYIIAMTIVCVTTLCLAIDRQYQGSNTITPLWRYTIHIIFMLIVAVLLINIVTVFLECGLQTCPDNPTYYKLI